MGKTLRCMGHVPVMDLDVTVVAVWKVNLKMLCSVGRTKAGMIGYRYKGFRQKAKETGALSRSVGRYGGWGGRKMGSRRVLSKDGQGEEKVDFWHFRLDHTHEILSARKSLM